MKKLKHLKLFKIFENKQETIEFTITTKEGVTAICVSDSKGMYIKSFDGKSMIDPETNIPDYVTEIKNLIELINRLQIRRDKYTKP